MEYINFKDRLLKKIGDHLEEHDKFPNTVYIPNHEKIEIMKLTADEVGSEVAGQIFRYGPTTWKICSV